MVILTRHHAGLRVWDYEGRSIAALHFYRDGAVVLSTRSGWIEPVSGSGGVGDLPRLVLEGDELRRAAKVNLAKGGHFFVPAATRSAYFPKQREIDIYVDLATGDCSVGEEFTHTLYEDASGATTCKARALTAQFGGEGQDTVEVMVPESLSKTLNAYGAKLAAVTARMQALGIDRVAEFHVERMLSDRLLLNLMLDANNALSP